MTQNKLSSAALFVLAEQAGFRVFKRAGRAAQIVAADVGSSGEALASLERFSELLLASQVSARRRVVVEVSGERVQRVTTDSAGVDVLVIDRDTHQADEGSVLSDLLGREAGLYAIADGIPTVEPEFVESAFAALPAELETPGLLNEYVEMVKQTRGFGGKNVRPTTADLRGIGEALGAIGYMGVEAVAVEPYKVIVSQFASDGSSKGVRKHQLGALKMVEGDWHVEVGADAPMLVEGGLQAAASLLARDARALATD